MLVGAAAQIATEMLSVRHGLLRIASIVPLLVLIAVNALATLGGPGFRRAGRWFAAGLVVAGVPLWYSGGVAALGGFPESPDLTAALAPGLIVSGTVILHMVLRPEPRKAS
ncbi:hypothetical protein [Actinoplanes sp. NPDC089786]|uniref:hypothetical protein n=1 Tax=Actinoplanes sp. NPDC089786 TaxID=3155185 RepID=UPI003430D06C